MAIGAVAASLTAILVLAGQLGYKLPTYVRAYELEELRDELVASHTLLIGGQKANTAEILAIQQRSNQEAIYRNLSEIDRSDRRGASDPEYRLPQRLIDERIYYESEADRLRRAMRKVVP